MMHIRREPTYLSSEVWRALLLLSKAVDDRDASPDSLADAILREVICEKYPTLLEHQRQVAKLESELMKTLSKAQVFYQGGK